MGCSTHIFTIHFPHLLGLLQGSQSPSTCPLSSVVEVAGKRVVEAWASASSSGQRKTPALPVPGFHLAFAPDTTVNATTIATLIPSATTSIQHAVSPQLPVVTVSLFGDDDSEFSTSDVLAGITAASFDSAGNSTDGHNASRASTNSAPRLRRSLQAISPTSVRGGLLVAPAAPPVPPHQFRKPVPAPTLLTQPIAEAPSDDWGEAAVESLLSHGSPPVRMPPTATLSVDANIAPSRVRVQSAGALSAAPALAPKVEVKLVKPKRVKASAGTQPVITLTASLFDEAPITINKTSTKAPALPSTVKVALKPSKPTVTFVPTSHRGEASRARPAATLSSVRFIPNQPSSPPMRRSHVTSSQLRPSRLGMSVTTARAARLEEASPVRAPTRQPPRAQSRTRAAKSVEAPLSRRTASTTVGTLADTAAATAPSFPQRTVSADSSPPTRRSRSHSQRQRASQFKSQSTPNGSSSNSSDGKRSSGQSGGQGMSLDEELLKRAKEESSPPTSASSAAHPLADTTAALHVRTLSPPPKLQGPIHVDIDAARARSVPAASTPRQPSAELAQRFVLDPAALPSSLFQEVASETEERIVRTVFGLVCMLYCV